MTSTVREERRGKNRFDVNQQMDTEARQSLGVLAAHAGNFWFYCEKAEQNLCVCVFSLWTCTLGKCVCVLSFSK